MAILQWVLGEQQCFSAHTRPRLDDEGLRRGGRAGQNVPNWALILESDSYRCTLVPPCSLVNSADQIATSWVPKFIP